MPTTTPIQLGVLNDYAIITAGLATLLQPYADIIEVHQFLVSIPADTRLDVVLFEAYGVPVNAIEARVSQINRATSARVIIFSWAEHQEQIDRAMRAGAAGFVAKTMSGAEIARCITAVHSGRPVVARPDSGATSMGGLNAWPGAAHGLTARESEILAFITSGLSNDEICMATYLSINSVKTHIRLAYRKINVVRRSQAVRWGIEHDFLTPAPTDV